MSKESKEYPKMLYRAGVAQKGSADVQVLVHEGHDAVHYRIAQDAEGEKALGKEGFNADFTKPGKRTAKAAKEVAAQ